MQQDKISIDLKLPTKWEDLTDKQLRYYYTLLALGFSTTEVKTYCLCRWADLEIRHQYGSGFVCRHELRDFLANASQVAALVPILDWLESIPALPVRLAKIGSHRAIDAQFQGVPFETFIVCDNLYQGYLATKQDNLLDELAAHLYGTQRIRLTEAERVSVFYWFASLKTFFARVFKHFFQPVTGASGDDGNMFEQQQSQYEQLQNAVNAQIRALTKGDVTKEQQVLSLDTWRALTELDCQAREYEELERKYPMK